MEQIKVDSLEKSYDVKLNEVCSICKTDKEEIKSNLEVNERDKDICDICKNVKDNEKSEMDNKMTKGICSKCMIHQNNKTAELNKAINSESICPACTDEMMNKEKSNDLAKKDSILCKEIFDQGICLYCQKMDEKAKSKIEVCKECQITNAKSQVTNIINEKRTIDNDNLCPACTGRAGRVNESKDIMAQNTLGKEECFYCKGRKEETRDRSKFEVCRGCQINNAKKEEMCPFCSNTKWNVISPTGSTLSTENKTEEQNKICPNCKKDKFDENQINVKKGKCPYCQKEEPTRKLQLATCQKCVNAKSAICNSDNTTDINKICPACTNKGIIMDEEESNKLSKITLNKDKCLFCRGKEVTNVQSKAEICKECQVTNAISENTKDSNNKCPACKDRFMKKLAKITPNKEQCSYCNKKEQAQDKSKIEACRECQIKNAKSEVKHIKDDKERCPFCVKNIEFIDQRYIKSPTESSLSVQNKSEEQNKMCTNCIKDERNNIQTATSSGICQLCEKDRAKSKFKMEELCSECKSKNIEGIKKQEKQSCPTCQSPADNGHKCDCSNSVQHKPSVKNISNACSSCGKKMSKEGFFTTDIPSCSCKNKNNSKQDILNACTNNNTSNARGTFKEIVKIKRFSGTDGITHEHITITSKKTQKRVLSEPSCGKNNNTFIKETQSDNTGLNKPISDICLSTCSSKKNISEKSSQNNSTEIASITSRSLLKKCEATCVPELDTEYQKKETNGCVACKKTSSRMSCRKNKSHDISKSKSCTNNNSYNKIKIIIKDDKCKDNSDNEEIELTASTIVILKKILSRTSKSADSCKSFEKAENKVAESKCSCGSQQSSLKCICKKANCDCNSKANTSLKIKPIKSEPCMRKTDSIDKKYSKDKSFCGKCDEQTTNSKQNKNTSNKCKKDAPEMSKLSTPTGSCQECGKKKNKKPSETSNCDCKKTAKIDERTCSCSKKQTVTIQKTCSCNNMNSKQASKCSSVESKYSHCCSESNETSSMANQTCLMDRLPVRKVDSGKCVCNEKKSAKNKLKDDCQCSKQIQPQAKSGSCSCQSVNKIASSANKSGNCSCKSSANDKKSDCQTKKDICSCSIQNQPQLKTTCSCQSVNKNAVCSSSNNSQECSCKSMKKKANNGCQCSKLKPEPKTSTCSCRSVNKSNQARECNCKLVHDDTSPCSCRKTNSKVQDTCGKQDINAENQQCSCSQSAKNLKSNVKFDNEPHKSLCPCKSSETGQRLKKSNSCSCKNDSAKTCSNEGVASTTCPCQASKLPSISPTQSNQSTTIASQTCCLPDNKPEKSIKFCDKASFPPNFTKSSTSISPKSSYISLRSRSSQIKSSQCSCGRKDASTMTRRSDRYDVRTLRQLSFPPEPKNLSCLCKSDSALLQIYKPKNVKSLNRCQSLSDQCCLRK